MLQATFFFYSMLGQFARWFYRAAARSGGFDSFMMGPSGYGYVFPGAVRDAAAASARFRKSSNTSPLRQSLKSKSAPPAPLAQPALALASDVELQRRSGGVRRRSGGVRRRSGSGGAAGGQRRNVPSRISTSTCSDCGCGRRRSARAPRTSDCSKRSSVRRCPKPSASPTTSACRATSRGGWSSSDS